MQLVHSEDGYGANGLYERRQAVPGAIGPLRGAVVDLASANGATDDQRDRVALAVSEALTNCAQHAYAGRTPPGVVTVTAWTEDGLLTVVITDEGRGMVPRVDSPGLGLGLSLISRMSERVDIEQQDHAGVSVRMSFALGG